MPARLRWILANVSASASPNPWDSRQVSINRSTSPATRNRTSPNPAKKRVDGNDFAHFLLQPPEELDERSIGSYWPRCARVNCSGALDTFTSPWKGWFISRMRRIAPATDSADTQRTAITVALRGAKRPKL